MQHTNYLMNMSTEMLNEHGLSKTLLTRRETIYLKHILKNLFVYGSEESLNNQLKMMQFKSLFKYMEYITNRIRGIYKLPRSFMVDDVNEFVRRRRNEFIKILDTYKQLNPLIILDFDNTITNPKFHSLYHYLMENDFKVIINSANPNEEVLRNYLIKHNLKFPKLIYGNKGKQKKIVKLKDIVLRDTDKIIFYIDDEQEYLDYGCMLGMYCYLYTRDGKLHSRTIFEK